MSNEDYPPDPINVDAEEDDDEIIKVNDESPAELVAPVPQPQLHIQRAGNSRAAVNVVAPPLETHTFKELFEHLLNKEVSIEIEPLSPGEYLVLIFMHFIQNSSIEGRFAVLRALERHGSLSPLISLMHVSTSLCDENLPAALAELNQFNIDPSFEPYVTELKNRLLARILKRILRAYSTTRVIDVSHSLGYQEPNETVEGILTKLNWTVDQQGFVQPTETEDFRRVISSAQDVNFGPEVPSVGMHGNVEKKLLSADALQDLVKFSELLDRPS